MTEGTDPSEGNDYMDAPPRPGSPESGRLALSALGASPLLIGMVHLAPLPGSPRAAGGIAAALERAITDAEALQEAGFDALIVENFLDAPFHPGSVPAVTVAAMTRIVAAVREHAGIPVGVNVLRNDVSAALSIAAVTGASFVRANVHTGAMWTDQGLITGLAHETLRLRRALEAPVAILADVHVKHAVPPAGSSIGDAAADAWGRGLADGLVVSGGGTGRATGDDDVAEVVRHAPGAPVFVGSGVTEGTVGSLPPGVRGAIVGSAVMRDGRAGSGVDPARARALVTAARGR